MSKMFSQIPDTEEQERIRTCAKTCLKEIDENVHVHEINYTISWNEDGHVTNGCWGIHVRCAFAWNPTKVVADLSDRLRKYYGIEATIFQ